jgi:hypothetical protein
MNETTAPTAKASHALLDRGRPILFTPFSLPNRFRLPHPIWDGNRKEAPAHSKCKKKGEGHLLLGNSVAGQ